MKYFVLSATALMALSFVSAAAAEPRVRECANIGGIYGWFPSDADELRKMVDKFLEDAGEVKVDGRPVAVVSPHAGFRWSAQTAAYGFKALKGHKYGRVIVLAPSHSQGFSGGSIADVDYYATPLGRIELDQEACRALLKSGIVASHPRAHEKEHSLQNELPFLQQALSDWKLVPVVLGAFQKDADLDKLAAAVKTVMTPDTLIVVSSDFTHYGDNFNYTPFRADLKENIRKLDQGAVDCITAVDPKAFLKYVSDTRATICGRYPIAVMLKLFEGRNDVRGTLMHYAASGEMTGDFANSVSYASIVLSDVDWKPETAAAAGTIENETGVNADGDVIEHGDRLGEPNQRLLLTMAREQLEKYVKEQAAISPKKYGWDTSRKLLDPGAVFVTLKNKGRLRGCIGDIMARQPLYMSVLKNTINAAAFDPRFERDRITEKELPEIDIEISYLTPMKPVDSYTDIVAGKHGVLLTKGNRRAVFLPQVAPEQGWDRDTMLSQLARKAGLPADAWKQGCAFEVFEAQVFGEKELKMGPFAPKKPEE